MKKIFSLFVISLCIICFSCSTGNKAKHKIQKGDFTATIVETGELDAVNSRIITIPYIGWKYGWEMKVIALKEHGTQVKVGDTLAVIDKANVMKFLLEKQTQIETEIANLNKLQAQHQSRLKEMSAEIASSEASLSIQKVQLDKVQFESEVMKKLKKLEYDREIIRHNKALKNSELTKKILENELKIQQIKISQLESDLKDADVALSLLAIISPLNGIMQVLKNRRTNQMTKVGDELWQGAILACVPDLSQMKIKAAINEADIGKIFLDQNVTIRLDAFPKIPFSGNIVEIGKLSYKKDEKDRSKVFDIIILLEKSDPILKPGMTVSCEIFTSELHDVYYIDNECIMRENGSYFIFMVNKAKCKKCKVEIGPTNNQFTVLKGEFKKGQQVRALSELEDMEIAQAGI